MKNWRTLEPDKYRLMNKNFTPGRGGHRIKKIVRHHNAGILTTEGCWQVWQDRPASAHYQVEVSGTIGQLVNDWDTAWHAANATVNAESIGIEHANSGGARDDWPISEATVREGGRLAGALCYAYGLGRPEYGVNVFDHRDFHGTSCPHHLAHGGRYDRAWFEAAQAMYNQLTHDVAPSDTPALGADTAPKIDERKLMFENLILDQLVGPGRDKDGNPTFNGWNEASIRDAAKTRPGGGVTLVELAALNREELGAVHARVDEQTVAIEKLAGAVQAVATALDQKKEETPNA